MNVGSVAGQITWNSITVAMVRQTGRRPTSTDYGCTCVLSATVGRMESMGSTEQKRI